MAEIEESPEAKNGEELEINEMLDELVEHTLDYLEEVADDLALNMPWEEAHKLALRDYLEELKARYEEEFGQIPESETPEEQAGNA